MQAGPATGLPDVLCVHVVDRDADAAAHAMRTIARHDVVARLWPDVAAFVACAHAVDSGCVVIDPYDADIGVAAVQARLADPDIGLPSVIVTATPQWQHGVDAMRRGAIDYLAKPLDADRLRDALLIARQRLGKARRREATMRRVHAALHVLSNREREVLEGLTRGWSNKEIGRRLAISARTVEIHRANVMAKLNAESLSQALRIAFIAQVCGMVNPALHVD
ncbi:LuxR C-terminal-related transcriptional regulator [Sphingomonas sp. A2-49]|uniref:response regulator transcription factor n=1 Tax=Sphingomonas sp. A2-49 TaxID=1391375 RepID=UPI0021D3B9DA|nr:LuxR C-terminal-related transcriptional regulator [Sphingomonas sp. A2-49]MCU6455489.1 LuxR C-terminal-related transcriptional regulator [Sphingomonas sp. A2-49]